MLMKQKKIEQDNLASSAKVAHDRPPLQPPVVSGTLTWSSIYHMYVYSGAPTYVKKMFGWFL